MADSKHSIWEDRLISPRNVLNHIKPGMAIFIGTGPAAPRTLIKTLLDVDSHNIRDLELVQLAVLGDTFLSIDRLNAPNHRLKTFFFRICGVGHHFLRPDGPDSGVLFRDSPDH